VKKYNEVISGTEPVTAAQLAASLYVTDPAQNAKLENLIIVARQQIESHCRIAIVKRTYTMFMDGFGYGYRRDRQEWWNGVREAPISELHCVPREIYLGYPPLRSVTSVSTFNDADEETVFAAGGYYVDNASMRQQGRVVLRQGGIWPVALRVANSVKVVFVAGYDDGSVPAEIKQAIIGVASWLYANPGDCDKNCTEMCGAAALVKSFVVYFPK